MKKLKEALMEYGCPENGDYVEESFDLGGCTYKQLRELLFKVGTILEEDENEKTYIATIRIKYNHATVALKLFNRKICILAYAKEGLLKQNTANAAINKIKSLIPTAYPDIKSNKPKTKKILLVIISLIILSVSVLIVSSLVASNAIDHYNTAANKFNEIVDDYNKVVSQTSVDNIDGIPTSIEKIKNENASIFEGFAVVFGKNSINKINNDTETIYSLVDQLNYSFKIISQITAPTGDWVESRLKNVEGITGTQMVDKNNNPDGMLGKEGGYTACVYFTFNKINPNDIPGEEIIDKGVDAGGSVEIYSTLDEAKARCEYLAQFDGTILYSGSYAIVGTTVIRTSYALTNEEQFELTNAITQALTKIQ